MVFEFLKRLTEYGGNSDFGEVLSFRLFRLFLCFGRELYGFCDLRGLQSHPRCMRFKSLSSLGVSYRGRLFFKENKVLVWFYAFDCLWVRDDWFMDFTIFGDSIALPRWMGL